MPGSKDRPHAEAACSLAALAVVLALALPGLVALGLARGGRPVAMPLLVFAGHQRLQRCRMMIYNPDYPTKTRTLKYL